MSYSQGFIKEFGLNIISEYDVERDLENLVAKFSYGNGLGYISNITLDFGGKYKDELLKLFSDTTISEFIFYENIEVINLEKDIIFNNCNFEENFTINNGIRKIINFLRFEDCVFNKDFFFADNTNNIVVNDLKFLNTKFFGWTKFDSFKVNKLSFLNKTNLNNKFGCDFNGITTFDRLSLNSISFIGSSINNAFYFYDINVDEKISFMSILGEGEIFIELNHIINEILNLEILRTLTK